MAHIDHQKVEVSVQLVAKLCQVLTTAQVKAHAHGIRKVFVLEWHLASFLLQNKAIDILSTFN